MATPRRAAALATAVMLAAQAAPSAALAAEKLCVVGSAALEQALADCNDGDVLLVLIPKSQRPQPQPQPSPSRPSPPPPSRVASLVARVCDLRREVFLQPGSTDEEFALTCVYAGRVLAQP